MKISLCMIVKDEEAVLARCLQSAKDVADELIIVDTGSTDGTKKIAEAFGAKIFDYEWTDDFAAARNFSFSKALGDYLLWLDADDFLPPESAERFPALKKQIEAEHFDVVVCPYDVVQNGETVCTFGRERLLRRESHFRWQGRVHECIVQRGKILRSDFRVRHLGSEKVRGARNLHIYQKWAAEEKLDSRNLFYYGRELYYNRLYTEACAVLEEMLAGEGWYVNKIEACKILGCCKRELGKKEEAAAAFAKSFFYGEPRAEILIELADTLRQTGKTNEAAFWYEAALSCRGHAQEGDFENPLSRALVPLLRLCRLYYERGDTPRAHAYHKKAEALFPDHPSVAYNRKYFRSVGLK